MVRGVQDLSPSRLQPESYFEVQRRAKQCKWHHAGPNDASRRCYLCVRPQMPRNLHHGEGLEIIDKLSDSRPDCCVARVRGYPETMSMWQQLYSSYYRAGTCRCLQACWGRCTKSDLRVLIPGASKCDGSSGSSQRASDSQQNRAFAPNFSARYDYAVHGVVKPGCCALGHADTLLRQPFSHEISAPEILHQGLFYPSQGCRQTHHRL